MTDYGCKNKLPHDYQPLYENPAVKAEVCKICSKRIDFKKDNLGRVDNNAYLDAHTRNFAQPFGPTAQIYYILYHPELYEDNKNRWVLSVCVNDECGKTKWKNCPHYRAESPVTIGDIGQKGTNG